jgi:hypothetical protein
MRRFSSEDVLATSRETIGALPDAIVDTVDVSAVFGAELGGFVGEYSFWIPFIRSLY